MNAQQTTQAPSSTWPWIVMAIAGLVTFVASMTVGPDAVQGQLSRILYVHVPSAWLAYLAFFVTMFASAMYLWKKDLAWDRRAVSSAEIGVVFTGLALGLGMIWAKPTWGVWWTWDARLTLTAIMFFVYLGYLALRRAATDPVQRARRSAVLGAVGALQIPLVYFSVNIWRTLHQTQSVRPDGASMPTETLLAMLVNLGAFTILFAGLLVWRADQLRIEEARLAETAATPNAGSAVIPPKLQPRS